MLEVVTIGGPALVQDGGRPGRMHQGVPPGGALVPELLAAANHAARNVWSAAALEIYGPLTLVARARALVALDGRAFWVEDGETVVIPRPDSARVRYLALRGGIDVPEVLGGKGTLLVAALGGYEGRALRPGDRLTAGPLEEVAHPLPAPLDLGATVRVIPGPDQDRFPDAALDALLGQTFTVSPASDRTGTRLQGPPLPRLDEDAGLSAPMVRGAIQVTLAGEPIVLGPDHPTTGGYPVLATVIRADWGTMDARRPGAAMRFRTVALAEARSAMANRPGAGVR